MYIINEHGVLNGWPDEWALLPGCRLATDDEIAAFLATGQQRFTQPPPGTSTGAADATGDKTLQGEQESANSAPPAQPPGHPTEAPTGSGKTEPAKPRRRRRK